MFEIVFAPSVAEDLAGLRAYDRARIVDEIEEQLTDQPAVATRRRKIMPDLEPPFDAVPPIWELRVGDWRVFYDVEEAAKKVFVRAVRNKPPHKTTEEIL